MGHQVAMQVRLCACFPHELFMLDICGHYFWTRILVLSVYPGELLAEACEFGIPHPPGYPLFTLASGVFFRGIKYLPFG